MKPLKCLFPIVITASILSPQAFADVPTEEECDAKTDKITSTTDRLERKHLYEEQAACYEKLIYQTKQVTPTINPDVFKDAQGNPSAQLYNAFVANMPQQTETVVNKTMAAKAEQARQGAQTEGAKAEFLGFNFGVGFAMVHYTDKMVDQASVVNGVIVSESEKENEAKVVLEFHQLWYEKENGDAGHGPFASLLVGDGDVLNGLGVGWLYSKRNKTTSDGSGFSLGFGIALENNVKQLAKGFKVGEALPTGETAVRFVEKDEYSPFLFVSNNF